MGYPQLQLFQCFITLRVKNVFLTSVLYLPLSVYTTVPCPVISAHIKSPSPSFYLSPFQALEGCSLQVSPRPSLLHVEQPRFSHPLSFYSQLMPVFGHSHRNEKELFSYNGVEFPIFKHVAFASYPVTRY